MPSKLFILWVPRLRDQVLACLTIARVSLWLVELGYKFTMVVIISTNSLFLLIKKCIYIYIYIILNPKTLDRCSQD